MRVLTRSASKRLAVLFVVLGALVFWSWWNMIRMPLRSYRGTLPSLTQEQSTVRDALRRHVEKLGREIGERNLFHPGTLGDAVAYVEGSFATAGYKLSRHTYPVLRESCHNLEAEIPGRARREEIIIVGAHYDSVSGSPGANDNATGVAAVLELARAWAGRECARTLRFVAFVNEEPPFFQTEQMGSLVYAKQCRQRSENVVAMLSLETMGYYSTDKGSQKYPFPVGLFYPSHGDFIGFVSHTADADLVRRCVGSFRRQVLFPSEAAALPGALPGIGWSDHWAFWQAGYPGVMVTDTAPFRYPHYHTEQDTPDKLDYERLARVVTGLDKVLSELVNK